MDKSTLLMNRLEAIGKSLAGRESALALIGLGSVGLELDRLDQYSDLDFFVIVKSGYKHAYLEDLSWLKEVSPVGYTFFNTQDGCKLLFEDGVFCEFAVFDEVELRTAVFSPGRIIWKAEGVSDDLTIPQRVLTKEEPHSIEWLVGEALTNLYVGLCREKRGEKLSAFRFIQGYAVDRVLELLERIETPTSAARDAFNVERRFEERFPSTTQNLPDFLQGYAKNRDSAKAILTFLEAHFEINAAIKMAILELYDELIK